MGEFLTETGIFIVSSAVLVGLCVAPSFNSSQNISSSANYNISTDAVSNPILSAKIATKKASTTATKKVVVPTRRGESDNDSGRGEDE